MPPYTPQFNSIEILWANVKKRFRERLGDAIVSGRFNQHNAKMVTTEVLNQVIGEIDTRTMLKTSKANWKFVKRVLNDQWNII